ncbi:alpha/beta hydrolase family protein [Mycolicibacterium psychrotolerans]|uniref:hypothetical protein n=1 Tax=Mycolicibacterium psychrotolerans TaxID=216929 RepID=UPI0013D41864|nr:hypothetical protein [Mycolicibacterium psychrotolerans]
MIDGERARRRPRIRYAVVAVALCAGIAAAPVPSIAWADPSGSDSTSSTTVHAGPADADTTSPSTGRQDTETDTSPSQSQDDAPKDEAEPEIRDRDADVDAGQADESDSTDHAVAERPSRRDETAQLAKPERRTPLLDRLRARIDHTPRDDDSTEATPPTRHLTVVRTGKAEPAAAMAPTVAEVDVPVAAVTPLQPQPLSPLGKLLQLPGHLVNTVLQIFDITRSSQGPAAPIKIAPPINDLLFAAFREVERWIGLDRTPPPQPPFPTLTYTGPTTAKTPTVAQFLNASAAAYGLGTTPGGLVPFTVNGFQMASANIMSGMAARVWVTPDNQIVIAYQGTTGGTNLLFNAFIAAAQILTDLQVIFTQTTPWAFHDALRFAERVQAAAAAQGYGADDIFVTGHSLGGWEAQYVAQQIGLAGVGFESPGMSSTVPGNGADSLFVNIETYGDPAPFMSSDLPGLQPLMPPYVPGGGTKPHYGHIVMIGDPAAMTPLLNAVTLWRTGPIRSLIFFVDFLGNFFQYHLPGIQAYHLGVVPDPGVVPWLGTARGPVNTGWGDLTITELLQAASDGGSLHRSTVAA